MQAVDDDRRHVRVGRTEILAQLGHGPVRHVRIPGVEGDVEIVAVVKKADLGLFGRELTWIRRPLDEVGGRRRHLPRRLADRPVDRDVLFDADGSEHLGGADGVVVDRGGRRTRLREGRRAGDEAYCRNRAEVLHDAPMVTNGFAGTRRKRIALLPAVVVAAGLSASSLGAQPAINQLTIIAPAAPGGGWDQTRPRDAARAGGAAAGPRRPGRERSRCRRDDRPGAVHQRPARRRRGAARERPGDARRDSLERLAGVDRAGDTDRKADRRVQNRRGARRLAAPRHAGSRPRTARGTPRLCPMGRRLRRRRRITSWRD